MGDTIHIDGKDIEIVDDEMAEVLRAKTGEERFAIAWGLWKSARRMMTAYLTDTHPDWTPEQVQAEVAKRMSHGAVG